MSVLRTQSLQRTAATLVNNAVTMVNLAGPTSPAETPYAEGTDHVERLRHNRQNEAGWAVVDLPAAFVAGNVWLRAVEIWASATPGQTGLAPPLFPTGATPAPNGAAYLKRVVFSTDANDFATNGAAAQAILGGELGAVGDKDVPALHVRADEFIQLRFGNTSGGDIGPEFIEVKYDLGLAPSDSGKP
jgi:hypothetical protein